MYYENHCVLSTCKSGKGLLEMMKTRLATLNVEVALNPQTYWQYIYSITFATHPVCSIPVATLINTFASDWRCLDTDKACISSTSHRRVSWWPGGRRMAEGTWLNFRIRFSFPPTAASVHDAAVIHPKGAQWSSSNYLTLLLLDSILQGGGPK